jgi:hypothetical protein
VNNQAHVQVIALLGNAPLAPSVRRYPRDVLLVLSLGEPIGQGSVPLNKAALHTHRIQVPRPLAPPAHILSRWIATRHRAGSGLRFLNLGARTLRCKNAQAHQRVNISMYTLAPGVLPALPPAVQGRARVAAWHSRVNVHIVTTPPNGSLGTKSMKETKTISPHHQKSRLQQAHQPQNAKKIQFFQITEGRRQNRTTSSPYPSTEIQSPPAVPQDEILVHHMLVPTHPPELRRLTKLTRQVHQWVANTSQPTILSPNYPSMRFQHAHMRAASKTASG